MPSPCGPHSSWFAWAASFLATVTLIAALGLLRAAQAGAATLPAHDPTAALLPHASFLELTEEEEEEEEEEEFEECEAGEEECEEEAEAAEEAEEERAAEAEAAAPACPLSEVHASVALAHARLRLQIRYAALKPTALTVSTWSRGSHGPFHLGTRHARFARRGSFRQSAKLTPPQRAKVAAARAFVVQLRLTGAPRGCSAAVERHLTSRHARHARLTWSEPK